jgi:hypothetical protein
MAESLDVIEIDYDNQLIAYLIRDTLTPYCAVIALGITNQRMLDFMVERLENCPCETQWWLIACDVNTQLRWVNQLALRFAGQVVLSKTCLTNVPNDAVLDLSNLDSVEHNEILHLGHLMLTIQYINANSLRVTLLVCDNTVFCLPCDVLSFSSTCLRDALNKSSIKWDKFSDIYSPAISAGQPLSASKLTFWQLEARLNRKNSTDILKH